jgi:hypothetical protein
MAHPHKRAPHADGASWPHALNTNIKYCRWQPPAESALFCFCFLRLVFCSAARRANTNTPSHPLDTHTHTPTRHHAVLPQLSRPPEPKIDLSGLRDQEMKALLDQGRDDAHIANLGAGFFGGDSTVAKFVWMSQFAMFGIMAMVLMALDEERLRKSSPFYAGAFALITLASCFCFLRFYALVHKLPLTVREAILSPCAPWQPLHICPPHHPIHTHTRTHTRTRAHTHTHTHTQTHTHTHTHTHTACTHPRAGQLQSRSGVFVVRRDVSLSVCSRQPLRAG